ncbi:hypothetical protein DNU06_17365 [Putridiphycobacter roseus]|uniref:Tetratricopeptide repeat protein n=1 Tax=Putridiphycobacter roseus TaxID=2219161 RepID=A0A2W1NBT4_9FLAO|nr:tetratricopeptide repeat protein [Putridiphycobacter roseus]PZE15576.1 hypothetical protein DNU06_17365 [Putridiphycobacter roseus]
MGIFDFLKKKNSGIEDSEFNSEQFQQHCYALAVWKLKESNNSNDAIRELKKIGLNEVQVEIILKKAMNLIVKETESKLEHTEFGISDKSLEEILSGKASKEQTKNILDKLFSFATFQSKKGKSQNAIDLFNKCILIDPSFVGSYVNLSALNHEMDNYEESLKNINKAIELDPLNKVLYENKAITCETVNNYKEEKKCYEKIVEIDSNDLDALFALSQCKVRDGEFKAALDLLNRVIDLAPNKEEIHGPHLSKIGILVELGFEKEAKDLYLKMTKQFPEDVSIHSVIPNIHYFKENKTTALSFFNSRFEETKDIQFLKYKADFLFHRDKENAIRSYDEYLKFNPEDTSALQCRLALQADTNKTTDTKSENDKILEIEPNNIYALKNRVNTLYSEKNFSEALIVAEKIYLIEKNRLNSTERMNSINMIIQICQQFMNEKDILTKFDMFQEENENEKYNIGYQKGLFFKSTGKFEEAIKVFDSQNEEHDFAWNYYQIAIIKNKQGKTVECLEHMQKAINLDVNIKQDAKQYHELENLFNNPNFIKLTE